MKMFTRIPNEPYNKIETDGITPMRLLINESYTYSTLYVEALGSNKPKLKITALDNGRFHVEYWNAENGAWFTAVIV